MPTNIILDNKLFERAKKLTGIKTKREVIHEALCLLILVNEQKSVKELRGKFIWEGNLHEQRTTRINKAGL